MDLRWPMDQDLRMNGLWTLGNYPSQTFKSFFIFPFCWTSGRCSWINIGSHVQRLVHQTYKVYSLSLRSPVSWTKTKKKKEVGPEMRLVIYRGTVPGRWITFGLTARSFLFLVSYRRAVCKSPKDSPSPISSRLHDFYVSVWKRLVPKDYPWFINHLSPAVVSVRDWFPGDMDK